MAFTQKIPLPARLLPARQPNNNLPSRQTQTPRPSRRHRRSTPLRTRHNPTHRRRYPTPHPPLLPLLLPNPRLLNKILPSKTSPQTYSPYSYYSHYHNPQTPPPKKLGCRTAPKTGTRSLAHLSGPSPRSHKGKPTESESANPPYLNYKTYKYYKSYPPGKTELERKPNRGHQQIRLKLAARVPSLKKTFDMLEK